MPSVVGFFFWRAAARNLSKDVTRTDPGPSWRGNATSTRYRSRLDLIEPRIVSNSVPARSNSWQRHAHSRLGCRCQAHAIEEHENRRIFSANIAINASLRDQWQRCL